MRGFRTLVVLLVFLCLIPPLSLLAVGLIARWAECQLDPDAPLRCVIVGGDYGDILFSIANFGWYAVATLPLLVALLVGWLLIESVRFVGRPKKLQERQAPAASRNRVRGS